jgi:hypothetical protein
VTFIDRDLYERSFETPAGPVDVLAEIVLHETQIELRDIAVYPSGGSHFTISPTELLGWARLAMLEIAEAGFDELLVTGTRLSGARPGRRVNLVIRLRKGQP